MQSPHSLPRLHTHTRAHANSQHPRTHTNSRNAYPHICSSTHTFAQQKSTACLRSASSLCGVPVPWKVVKPWATEPQHCSLRGHQRVKREHFQGVCLLINTVNSFPFTNINSWQSVTKKERGKKKNLNPTLVKSLPLPIFFFPKLKLRGIQSNERNPSPDGMFLLIYVCKLFKCMFKCACVRERDREYESKQIWCVCVSE